jgi:hypothetical protein
MISVIFSLLAFGFLGAKFDTDDTFGEEGGVFGGGNSEFVVEAVMPDLGHVIPVVDDTVLNRVGKFEDTLLGLSLFSHVGLFVVHADHDVLILGPAHNGGEGRAGSVIPRKTCLAHT